MQILQHQQQPQFAIRGQMQPGGIMQQRMMQPQMTAYVLVVYIDGARRRRSWLNVED